MTQLQDESSAKAWSHSRRCVSWESGETLSATQDLKKIAETLGERADFLLFDNVPRNGKVDIGDREMLKQFEELAELTSEDLSSVKKLIDGFLLRDRMAKKFLTSFIFREKMAGEFAHK